MSKIVLDTNVWVYALSDEEFEIESAMVISEVAKRDDMQIAIDYEGKILTEYERNIGAQNRMYQMYHKRFYEQKRFVYCSSNLIRKHEDELNRKGFHEPEDQVFVGVAMNADKIIVSNDSDYGIVVDEKQKDACQKKEAHEYMTQKMGLQLYTSRMYMESCIDN